MIKIKVVEQKLTDGSRVYDVYVRDCDAEPLILPAADKTQAINLACGIYNAIQANGMDSATLEVA